MIAARELLSSGEIFRTLVERQMRLRVKRALIGAVWPVIAPAFLLGLYVFVFKGVFTIPIPRYPEYLFAGLLPWTYLAQTLGKAISSISLESEMVRKSPFPYALLPLSEAAAHAVSFLITLGIFVAYLAVVGHLKLALLPVLVFPVTAVILLVMSLSMLTALIDVYSRDLRLVLANLLTIWFFLVPIVYRPDMAPKSLSFLDSIDPMNMIVGQMRAVLYYHHIARPLHMLWMLCACLVLFVVSSAIFRKWAVHLPQDV